MSQKYKKRREMISFELGIEPMEFELWVVESYTKEKLSTYEIAELISARTTQKITGRTINRIVAKYGVARSGGDAFRLAGRKGRIKWAYKDPRLKVRRLSMPEKLRFQVLERDKQRCVYCGATASDTRLEIDHKIALAFGGQTILDNLQVLCVSCNRGKQIAKNER